MAKRGRKNFEPVSASHAPRMADLTVGDYANGMPNIRLGEMFKSLIRQMFWMLPLIVIGFFVFGYLTKDLKREYTGTASIHVKLGPEHVYSPVGETSNGGGLMTTIDTITLTEAGLMRNERLVAQVIGNMTSGNSQYTQEQAERRFDKEAFKKINAAKRAGDEFAFQEATMELRKSVFESYSVMPRAKSSIIDVTYSHDDPDVAVETVNMFVNSYLPFRKGVFVEGSSELITERRVATEEQLDNNERAIARFLKKNNIADFESEQTGLRERNEDLKAALNGTRASIAETEAALAQVEDRLRQTPVTIDLFVDDRAAQRVSQAELELRQLMAKYLPTSDPVRQKRTELEELRALQNSYNGKASGGRRVGPNPEHQALAESRNELAATADSLREREFAQQRQLNSADAKIRKLTSLSPEFQNLLRERETLEARLSSYNAKEQEALVDAQQKEAQAENVKIVSEAEFANKGRNMRKLAWFGATIAWAFLLFFIAMIRVFLDPRLYAVPGAMRMVPVPQADVDMEPMYAPVQEPVHAPLQSPIPEPVPEFDPRQPMTPNPYEARPAAYADQFGGQAYPQNGQYDPNDYVYYGSTGDVHHTQAAQGNVVTGSNPYQSGFRPDQAPSAYAGTGALDISHNPYAAGDVQAGSLDYPNYVPDPNAPPQS